MRLPLKWYIFLAIFVNIREYGKNAIVLLQMFNLLSMLFLHFFKLSFHGNYGKDAKTRVRESVCQLPLSVICNIYHIFRAFLAPKSHFFAKLDTKYSRMDSTIWVFESVPYIFNSSNSNPFLTAKSKARYGTVPEIFY